MYPISTLKTRRIKQVKSILNGAHQFMRVLYIFIFYFRDLTGNKIQVIPLDAFKTFPHLDTL